MFKPEDTKSLIAFTDADWGCGLDDKKSIGGFCVYFAGNLIPWSSKRQTIVARSSTESEYHLLSNTAAELVWLTSLLKEMKIENIITPIIWCDNNGATSLAANSVNH